MLGCLLSIAVVGCGKRVSPREGESVAVSGISLTDEVAMEPPEVDLGAVPVGNKPQPFVAYLVNRGQSELKLGKVESSCGCMAVQIDSATCPPGGRIRVTGQIRTGQKAGLFRQTVKLIEKGELGRMFRLQIIGEVQSKIQLVPESVTLRPSISLEKPSTATFVVRNNAESVIRLQQPIGLPDGIEVRIAKTKLQAGEESEVVVTAAPTCVSEEDCEFSIPTTHPTESVLKCTIRMRPVQSVRVSPQSVRLGIVTKKQLLKRGAFSLRIGGLSLARLRLGRTLPPPFLRVTKKVEVGDGIDLHFEFVDAFSGIDLTGAIALELERGEPKSGNQKLLRLNVAISGLLQDG